MNTREQLTRLKEQYFFENFRSSRKSLARLAVTEYFFRIFLSLFLLYFIYHVFIYMYPENTGILAHIYLEQRFYWSLVRSFIGGERSWRTCDVEGLVVRLTLNEFLCSPMLFLSLPCIRLSVGSSDDFILSLMFGFCFVDVKCFAFDDLL